MIFGYRRQYILDQDKDLDTGYIVDDRSPPSTIAINILVTLTSAMFALARVGEELGMLDLFRSVSYSGRLYSKHGRHVRPSASNIELED